MSYMDKTFCEFYIECKEGDKCHRALTPKTIVDANNWMNNPPISVFIDKPKCFESKE